MSQLTLTTAGDVTSIRLTDDDPRALGPDDVRIAIEAAPINNSDFLLAAGRYPYRPAVPHPMGSEGVGRVLEAGSAVDATLVGRRVLVLPNGEQGTWGDRVLVPARNVLPVSDTGDPLQQSMLTINPATAYLLLNRYVQVKPGDWVGQDLGNSAVGQQVIALARRAGVRTLSVVRSEAAAKSLLARGADVVLVDGDDLTARIKDALAGDTLSLALTGGATVAALASALPDGGTVVAYSAITGQPPAVPLGDLLFRELSLHGFWLGRWLRDAPRPEIEATYALLAHLLDDGLLHADVDTTYPFTAHEAAFTHATTGHRTGKIVFRP